MYGSYAIQQVVVLHGGKACVIHHLGKLFLWWVHFDGFHQVLITVPVPRNHFTNTGPDAGEGVIGLL